jgi:hypothetical protein
MNSLGTILTIPSCRTKEPNLMTSPVSNVAKRVTALAFLFAATALLAQPAHAACSGSSPNLSASTWADVAVCHTLATNGDTITVSSGSYIVTTQTNITKYVKIVAGGSVTLTDNVCAGACSGSWLITLSESEAGSTVLQGFTFVQGTSRHEPPAAVINMGRYSQPVDTGKPIIIRGNSYRASGTGDFIHASVNKGVVTGNTMDATPALHLSGTLCITSSAGFLRQKMASPGPSLSSIPYYGSADNDGQHALYVENNTAINVIENFIDIDDFGRGVVRYNTLTNSSASTHGNDTSGTGNRYMELYGNRFIRDASLRPECLYAGEPEPVTLNLFVGIRGGTDLIHNNIMDNINDGFGGDKDEIGLFYENLRRYSGPFGCWGTITAPGAGYPGPFQTGWGYSVGGTNAGGLGILQDLEPLYIFGNTGSGRFTNIAVADYSPNQCSLTAPRAADYVVPNRDYYNQTGGIQISQSAPFNGTSGTGFGTIANRPASCTTGVAYWATDEGGNWNSTNGAANDGKMYICTSTNTWTARYGGYSGNTSGTPYMYPHPLAGNFTAPTITQTDITAPIPGNSGVITTQTVP